VERTLNRLSAYLLAAATLISVGVTLPRFAPGVPMSVDTTSHLYKIIFLQYWWKQGLFPFWSADWYAGSPALLLYPPLGYFLTAGISMLGIDPVFAYKLVDALFYCMAPATMYVLGKELGFSQGESALAALLFSLFPEVIENYLFFDRFPTVLAIPISCAFLIFFHRALTKRNSTLNLLLSIIAMSGLLLVHHLSALITGIVAVLLVLVTSSSQGVAKPTLKLAVVALGTFGITAFWLVPFLTSYNLFSANQFYNRNVIFPFLRFTYFGYDVASYLLGIAQFIFAAVAVQSIIKQNFAKRIPLDAIRFFPLLLAGMAFFQAGEIAALDLLEYLGEIIAALSFAVFLGQFVFFRKARVVLSRSNGTVLTVFWFTLFLWMGLGYYALPVLELPIISDAWIKTMDVYRIWLYLALPMSALSARGIIRSAHRILNWRPFIVFVLLVLAITPVTTSIALKINYDLNNSVNGVLPYSTANAEIPPAIINYFQNDASDGRILGINVPFWIYILPSYVNKTIIDGWYPQTKLITPLVNINDYRLDDLETAPNETARLNTWRSLVLQAQLLDITWVIIGDNGVLAHSVMHDANFTEQLTVPYGSVNLVVYKSLKIPAFVTTVSGNLNMINTVSSNPDRMTISFQPSQEVATIMVKEAYFPTWTATADANPVVVGRDSATGYILLTVPAGTSEISLYQTTNYGVWDTISLISLIVCLALSVALLLRLRKPGE
jgi:hypothetical protein